MAAPNGRGPDDRLDGWKQIAAYVGHSERTVRRWERSEGFPVHRSGHKKPVWAYKSGIDAWWDQRSEDPVPDLEVETGPEPEPESEPVPEPEPSAPPVAAPTLPNRAASRFPQVALIAVLLILAATLVVTRPWSPRAGAAPHPLDPRPHLRPRHRGGRRRWGDRAPRPRRQH